MSNDPTSVDGAPFDLADPSARPQRDALVCRDDVLEKVKRVALMSGTSGYATVEMVADYFEVGTDAIEWHLRGSREELSANGMQVLRGSGLSEFKAESGYESRAGSLTVFTRRAILNLGMLLRDSVVAKALRAYLLNVEVLTPLDARAIAEATTRADLARMILEAEEEKSVLAAALESAAPAIAYHDRYVANGDAATVKVWAAQFGMTQPEAFTLLVDKRLIYRVSLGERWSDSEQRKITEYEYRAYAKCIEWFDLRPQHNAPRHHNGQVRQTLYIRQQFALEIAGRCGLPMQLSIGVPIEGADA